MRYEAEAKMVSERYWAASTYWNPIFTYWRKLMRTYRQEFRLVRDDNNNIKYPWRSKIFLPEAFELIETIVPQITESIFHKDDFFSVIPGRGELDEYKVQVTEKLLEFQARMIKFRPRIVSVLQEMVMLGTKIVRVDWSYKTRIEHHRRIERFMGIVPIGETVEEKEVEVYDGPDFVEVPFYCFFLDPFTKPNNIQSAEYTTEEIVKSWPEFVADAEYFEYEPEAIDYISKMTKEGTSTQATYDERGFSDADPHQRRIRQVLYFDNDMEILVGLPGGTQDDKGVVLKIQSLDEGNPDNEYPYAAFQMRYGVDEGVDNTSDSPDKTFPGGFFPLGDLHSLQSTSEALNASVNMRFDVVHKGMNPPLFLASEAIEDESELEDWSAPDRIIRLTEFNRPMSDIMKDVPIRDYMGSGWESMIIYLKDLQKRTSGAEDSVAGRGDPRNRTATGVVQATANASLKFGSKSKNAVWLGLIPLLEKMAIWNAEFMSPDTELYITGQQGVSITANPEDIVRGCGFIIKPSAYYNRALLGDMIAKYLPLFLQYPNTNVTRLMQKLVDSLEIFDDPSSIIPDEEEPIRALMMQEIQTQLNAQSKAQQQSSGGGDGQGGVPGTAQALGPGGNISAQSSAEAEVQKQAGIYSGS